MIEYVPFLLFLGFIIYRYFLKNIMIRPKAMRKVEGRIDSIRPSSDEIIDSCDVLIISNGKSFFFGHETYGRVRVQKPHGFKKGQKVIVTLDGDSIVDVGINDSK